MTVVLKEYKIQLKHRATDATKHDRDLAATLGFSWSNAGYAFKGTFARITGELLRIKWKNELRYGQEASKTRTVTNDPRTQNKRIDLALSRL